jgi:ATP-dependent helicase HrpB
MDSRVGPRTRVELVTDGLFLRRLQDDPALDGVGCVVFDEFHERGWRPTSALALTLESRAALNPALRLVVMSATLDAAPVAALLGDAPIVTSEGRAHPVETRYLARALPGHIEAGVAQAIGNALAQEDGSVLAFLPGAREIRRVAAHLADADLGPTVIVAPLYGDLAAREQDAAVDAGAAGSAQGGAGQRRRGDQPDHRRHPHRRRFWPGARAALRPALGHDAPRDRARQPGDRRPTARPCRPARSGVCVRLWTEPDQRARTPHPVPEILAADLTPLALELAVWGAGDGRDLAFLDPPPSGALAQARDLLAQLGALDAQGRPTAHGRAMSRLGLHPRLAHMILAAAARGLGRLACETAAVLSERDLFRGATNERDADLCARIATLRGERARSPSTGRR